MSRLFDLGAGLALRRLCLLGCLLGSSGCYAAHVRPLDGGPAPDAPCALLTSPRCVARSAGPCSPWQTVAAVCDGSAFVCPRGAEPPRPRPTPSGCAIFADELPGPHETVTAVPFEGRCAWVLGVVQRADGTRVFAPASFAPDDLSTCPLAPDWIDGVGESIVDIEELGPEALPQLGEPFEARGALHVPVRVFVVDPGAPFGVSSASNLRRAPKARGAPTSCWRRAASPTIPKRSAPGRPFTSSTSTSRTRRSWS